jgi:PBP1b-binding outer membrane lipoprotein LpoB
MKKSIIPISVLSAAAMMLVSCASEPQTTTTTTRQTTVTTEPPSRPMQAIGYRDNNMETGGPGLRP